MTELLLLFLRSIDLVPERSISRPFCPMNAVDMIGDVGLLSVMELLRVCRDTFLCCASGELGTHTSFGVMLNVSKGLFGNLFVLGGGGEVGCIAKGGKK